MGTIVPLCLSTPLDHISSRGPDQNEAGAPVDLGSEQRKPHRGEGAVCQ